MKEMCDLSLVEERVHTWGKVKITVPDTSWKGMYLFLSIIIIPQSHWERTKDRSF